MIPKKSPTGKNSDLLDSSEYDYIEEEKSSENDDSQISPPAIIEEDYDNFESFIQDFKL